MINNRKTLLEKVTDLDVVGKLRKNAALLGLAAASLGVGACAEVPGASLKPAIEAGTSPVEITPNNPPKITSNPVTQVDENTAYRYDVNATDDNGDTLIYSLHNNPAWLSINSETGIISGTAPDVTADKRINLEARVSDGKEFAKQEFTLTVKDVADQPPPLKPTNNPPKITSNPVTQVDENTAYRYDVNATDDDGDTLIYSLHSNPAWLSINSETGIISGTAPDVTADKRINLEARVSDGKEFAKQEFTLTVKDVADQPPLKPTNNPPKITSNPVTQVDENTAYRYDVNATDDNGDTLIYSLHSNPAWLSINSETGIISGTAPDVTADKRINLEARVSDGKEGTDKQTFTLTVRDISAPILTTDISGTLKNSETDTGAAGEVRAYKENSDGTYTLLKSTTADSSGRFSLSFTQPSESEFDLQARLKDGNTDKSYVRTKTLPTQDDSGVSIKAVPYTGLSDTNSNVNDNIVSVDEFKTFMEEVNKYPFQDSNFRFIGHGPIKWNPSEFQGVEILQYNPTTNTGSFTTTQQDYIENKIHSSDDIKAFFGGAVSSITVQKDTASNQDSNKHYSVSSNEVSPDTGWIVVVPEEGLGSGAAYGGDGDSDGDIDHYRIRLESLSSSNNIFVPDDRTISHEFAHAIIYPGGDNSGGHTLTLRNDQSITSNYTLGGVTDCATSCAADKKAAKLIYGFPVGTTYDDVLRTSFY